MTLLLIFQIENTFKVFARNEIKSLIYFTMRQLGGV